VENNARAISHFRPLSHALIVASQQGLGLKTQTARRVVYAAEFSLDDLGAFVLVTSGQDGPR